MTAVVEKLADSSFPEMLVAVSAGTSPEVSENAWEEERERPELPVRDAATVAEADTASTELAHFYFDLNQCVDAKVGLVVIWQ